MGERLPRLRRTGPFVRRVETRGRFPELGVIQGMPSTVIRHFDYDPRTAALDIEFVSGRRYRYAGVPSELAEGFRGAFSKGRFFNAHIRDDYPCEELSVEPAGDLWEL